MLNIVMLDERGETHGLAASLARQGHIVKLWSEFPEERTHQTLFGPRQIDTYKGHLEAADFVVSNNLRTGGVSEAVREGGRLALGGRVQAELVDGSWQDRIAQSLSLPLTQAVPQYAVCGLFDGTQWKGQFHIAYMSRLLDGEQGPYTEGLGCVATPCKSYLLSKLTAFLTGLKLAGMFTLRLNFDGRQLSLVEFSTDLEPQAMAAIREIVRGDELDLLMALVKPERHLDYHPSMLGCSLRLAYWTSEDAWLNDTPAAYKHFWPEVSDSSHGLCSARGYSPKELRSRVYYTLDSLVHQGIIYRRDLPLTLERLYEIQRIDQA